MTVCLWLFTVAGAGRETHKIPTEEEDGVGVTTKICAWYTEARSQAFVM